MKTTLSILAVICIAATFATDGTIYMPSFAAAAGFSAFTAIALMFEKKPNGKTRNTFKK